MSIRAASAGSETFGKVMNVLRCVAQGDDGASFPELIKTLGIPKSTLHRFLRSLVSEGLLRFDESDRRYRLGLAMFELARNAWARIDVRREAQGVINALVRETGETVHLAVLDGLDVVYVDKVEGLHTIRMASKVGARNPAYCTGVGKALLAYVEPRELAQQFEGYPFEQLTPNTITSLAKFAEAMAHIRAVGFAEDNEEHEPGIRCAAAPIFNYRGAAIASISITVPSFRWDVGRNRPLTDSVSAAAATVTANCGGIAGIVRR